MTLAYSTDRSGTVSPAAKSPNPVRVMVVDDSVVIRGVISRWLEQEAGLCVVASKRNGKDAVADLKNSKPDVIVLDIEMPVMDGLTALPLILAECPGIPVIMASTLTTRNAKTSLKALELGAADYIPKPESTSGVSTSQTFRDELIRKATFLGRRYAAARDRRAPGAARNAAPFRAAPASAKGGPIALRPFSSRKPEILLIGSSTGGPQALQAVVAALRQSAVPVPVLITQHMPPTFTAVLAEHLARASGLETCEAEDRMPLKAGRIVVAKGGHHMVLERAAGGTAIRLTDSAPVHFCKPAVDPLFESGAALYGPAVLAAVLTGMGSDGANGATKIADAGGSVVAQDEKTSVVWGMPGAAAKAGACAAVLPLNQIGSKLSAMINGGRT